MLELEEEGSVSLPRALVRDYARSSLLPLISVGCAYSAFWLHR